MFRSRKKSAPHPPRKTVNNKLLNFNEVHIHTLACPLLIEVSAFCTLIWTNPATMKDRPAITIPTTIRCRGLQ